MGDAYERALEPALPDGEGFDYCDYAEVITPDRRAALEAERHGAGLTILARGRCTHCGGTGWVAAPVGEAGS
jgi:hypothetical protein